MIAVIDVAEEFVCEVSATLARRFPDGLFYWREPEEGEDVVWIIGDLPYEQWADVVDEGETLALVAGVQRQIGEPVLFPRSFQYRRKLPAQFQAEGILSVL